MNYYFDPSFGYFYITASTLNDTVRYGRGPVTPHDPSTLEDQKFTRFETWIEIPPHHVPDEWLVAFANKEQKKEERILVLKEEPINLGWGWAEWFMFAVVCLILGALAIKL